MIESIKSMLDRGNYRQALAHGFYSLKENPNCEQLYALIGSAYLEIKEYDNAIIYFKKSLTQNKNQPEILFKLALSLDYLHKFEQAIACYQEVIQQDSTQIGPYINLSGCYLSIKNFIEAENEAKKGLELAPYNIELLNNLLVAQTNRKDYEQAEQTLCRAKEVNPHSPELHVNQAKLFIHLNKYPEAITHLIHADKLRPNDPTTLYNLALALLCQQHFEEGWHLYLWRFQQQLGVDYLPDPAQSDRILSPPDDLRLDQINSLKDHNEKSLTLLAIHEQGLGDELFFLRFANSAILKPHQLFYYPSKKLYPLLKSCLKYSQSIKLINPYETVNYTKFDIVTALGDLPTLTQSYHPNDTLPVKLTAPGEICQIISHRYHSLPKPWIGITYSAGLKDFHETPEKQVSKREWMAQLPTLTPVHNGTLFILQPSSNPCLINELKNEGYNVIDGSSYYDNLIELTALLSLLDEYIGVCNTNMYIREGLEQRSNVILTAPIDFRWSQKGHRLLWFNHTEYCHAQNL